MATKKTSDLATAQEAFYSALKRSADTVASLRLARTGHRRGTAEFEAQEPSPQMLGRVALVPEETASRPARPRRTPSQMRVSSPEMTESEFQATLMLIRRLQQLGEEEDVEIVCLSKSERFRNGNAKFTCKGLQSFWTRSGKVPPRVYHSDEELPQVIARKPVAIFMDPDLAPCEVSGYIKVVLDEPHFCLLLRAD